MGCLTGLVGKAFDAGHDLNPATWPLLLRKVGDVRSHVLRKRWGKHLVSTLQRLRGKTGWVDSEWHVGCIPLPGLALSLTSQSTTPSIFLARKIGGPDGGWGLGVRPSRGL